MRPSGDQRAVVAAHARVLTSCTCPAPGTCLSPRLCRIPLCSSNRRGASLPSVCTFITLEIVKPSALRHAIPVEHISSADQGCEKTNCFIATDLSGWIGEDVEHIEQSVPEDGHSKGNWVANRPESQHGR